MCSATSNSRHPSNLPVPYIANVEDFLQHLYAVFFYLHEYPVVGDYSDNYDGHVVMFQDVEITFFTY